MKLTIFSPASFGCIFCITLRNTKSTGSGLPGRSWRTGGYRLSPGTLYPMLHAMERKGYLTSRLQREGRDRKVPGRGDYVWLKGLALAKIRVREFTGEAMKH